jgi:TPR repeat protein
MGWVRRFGASVLMACVLAAPSLPASAGAASGVMVPAGAAADLDRALDYLEGKGVEKDVAKGMGMLRQLAERGDAMAQYDLGHVYGEGTYVPRDDAEAMRWLEMAAASGLAEAEDAIGGHYANGNGVAMDRAKASYWYRRAAERGYARAQYNLGTVYLSDGQGVPQDPAQARAWLTKAADQGEPRAQYNLALMYARGFGVEQDYGKAKTLYEASAARGNAKAMNNLGQMYSEGWGVPRDPSLAMTWYRKGAVQGNPMSQYNVGVMYAAPGPERDLELADAWLQLSLVPATGEWIGSAKTTRAQIASEISSDQMRAANKLVKGWSTGVDLADASRLAHALEREYAVRPRRKYISASTVEPEYALYMREWKDKVERTGNASFPREFVADGKRHLVVATVAVRRDGSFEELIIDRSSGSRAIDDWVRTVVRLAAPFAPIPRTADAIDLLYITRTWVFVPGEDAAVSE